MKKILVVGQTPPPYGGQAIMIDSMLKADFSKVRLYHVRMDFSKDMDEVGKFKLSKLTKLLALIGKVYYYRVKYNIQTLYYPPAPPNMVPVLRDIIVLNAIRWLFKSTIFHFHAAGVSELYPQFRGGLKKLYERAYFYPDVCIRLSEYNPEDGKVFKMQQEYIIPNGLDDVGAPYLSGKPNKPQDPLTLLYVGVLCESKGILILLESASLLAQEGYRFTLQLMGRFESEDFRQRVNRLVAQWQLASYVEFLGVRTGEAKYQAFAQADVFCYPTFFEAETFGLVALEAMQFGLPVVATRWRGVPSVVIDKVSGFVVPPRNAVAFSEKLALLLENSAQRKQLGNAGRKIYCEKFTAQAHFDQLETAFTSQ